jgi:hypothetical protein
MPEDTQNLMPDSAKVAPPAVDQASSTDVNGLASNGLDNQIPAAQANPSSALSPSSDEDSSIDSNKMPADQVYPASGEPGPASPTDTLPRPDDGPTPLPTDAGTTALEVPKQAEAPVVMQEQAQYGGAPAPGSVADAPDQQYQAH